MRGLSIGHFQPVWRYHPVKGEFTGQTVIEVSVLLFLRIHFLGQCDGIVYRRYAVGFILGESAHSAPCKGKHYKKLFHVD